MKDDKYKKQVDALRNILNNMSEEELEEMREHFRDKRPKGWLSIEEELPMMSVEDLSQGYSVFKVRDVNGKEFESAVTDHHIWYYRAKDAGITHWLNE